MARKLVIYCELCGSDALNCTTDFIVFHHLSFCSPDCHDEYRAADEARRESRGKPSRPARTAKAA